MNMNKSKKYSMPYFKEELKGCRKGLILVDTIRIR